MKALVQRVLEASVSVEGRVTGQIGPGLLVYWGLEKGDTLADLEWLGQKILAMRIFEDAAGKMNLSLTENQPASPPRGLLLVSQFTLAADLRRGRRPGFDAALPVEEARAFWPQVLGWFNQRHSPCAAGEFQAAMRVASINDGPATFWLDAQKR